LEKEGGKMEKRRKYEGEFGWWFKRRDELERRERLRVAKISQKILGEVLQEGEISEETLRLLRNPKGENGSA
jgi:hypothetical protein